MRRSLSIFCMTALLGLGVACSGEPEQNEDTCASDSECKGDRICNAGECVDPSGGGGGGTGGGGGGGGGETLDCNAECSAKLQACQAPPEFQAQCAGICAELNNEQVLCLKNASCETLAIADSPQAFCESGGGGGGGGGGGSADMGGGGGGGGSSCTSAPTCEGDTLVSCDDSGGFPVTMRTTCDRGCENNACVGPISSSRIEGDHPSGLEPTSVMDNGTLFTLLSFSADITSDPDNLAGQVSLSKASSITVDSPSATGCDVQFGLTMNRSEINFQLSGSDVLPATDCLKFLKDAADNGVRLTLQDVPELNSVNTLTLELVSK